MNIKVNTLYLVLLMSLIWGSTVAQETGYEWTWIGGSNTTRTSIFGTQGVPAPQNIPGGGKTDMYTTDQNGNFWLYGGGSGSSVLWKNDGTGWAWIAGTSTDITGSGFYPDPVYGTKGVADPANRPSVRSGGTLVADSQGNIWLFGGYGEDSSGNLNMTLNDLWKFDGTNWTWISGSNLGHQTAVYGTKGVADPLNVPGTRSGHVMWVDNQDNIWIFGGDGWATTTPNGGTANRLNDLWKFDGTNWTWMAGNNGYFQQGVYGTKGVADPINTPGARYGADGWTDANGDLYLFGGTSHGQVSATGSTSSLRPINDLWKFDGSNWTWIKGADTLLSEGVYGTKGIANPANNPSARTYFSLAKASNGDVYVYAGYGIDSNGSFYNELSDVWKFDGLNWTWVSGTSTGLEAPNFGTLGVVSENNSPGSRHSAAMWMRNNEAFVFGGKSNYGSPYPVFGLNDFWRLTEASQETELIAYYKFSGNSADSSVNSYDLVANDNPELTSDRGGEANSAYLFDGENDFFTTQDSAPFELQNFTYSMWINPFAFALPNKTATFISTQQNFETTGFYSFINVDGRIGTYVNDGNSLIGFLGQFLNIGEWVHYAFSYDGNRLQTYVNGQPTEGLDLGATVIYNGSSPLTIGGNSRPENDFSGKMDEILVYNQALSAAEIDSIYNTQVPDVLDNTSQWTSVITTNANGKNSTAEFGTTPISTDGFDASLDIPLPPAPTGDYLQLYFAHPEFGGTLGDKYRSDYKGYSDYESSNSNWKLSLYSTFAANDTLFITRSNGFTAPIKVIDSQGMEYISLSGDLEVLYSTQAGETLVFDIVVGDIFPPTIELGAIMDGPQIWDKTQSRTLTWTVEDPSGITNITTEVSYDGGSTWQAIYTGLDQSFNFTPDANIVLNEATFFRVSATDGASQEFTNSTTVASNHEITIAAPSQSLDFSTGWQMVGSPFADSIEPTSVLSDAIRYRWNTESFEYVLSNTYPNKEGIWLGGYSNGSDQLDGEVGETDATFTVYGGWNMVTVPLFRNVQVDSISVFDGTTTRTFSDAVSNFDITVPQGYNDAGYTTAESLEFFKSYWIGVTGDSLKLTLPIHRFNPVLKQSQIMEEDEILLTIVDGEFEQQLLIRVGGNPSQPAPPPAPNAHKIGLKGESTILGNTYTQYSLSSSEQEGAEIPLVIGGPERLLTMKWQKTGFESVPILLKAMENHTLDSPNGSIEISSTELSSAILAIGNFAVSNEVNRGVPVAFKLNQNYPNPFNPSTTIGFDLPEKAVVQIDVFNVTGQKVATIVNSTLQPGSHTVQFDASELSSGTYIYRIQAGSFFETRKMILIK
jgi:hypothetical protein